MDIDSNLREQRRIIECLIRDDEAYQEDDVRYLIDLFCEMDEWLTSGGHKPSSWL